MLDSVWILIGCHISHYLKDSYLNAMLIYTNSSNENVYTQRKPLPRVLAGSSELESDNSPAHTSLLHGIKS